MKHPDEHTLELYVLNAESVASLRGGIESHLATCAGCRALVGEMSSFYADLERELKNAEDHKPVPGKSALTKRRRDLTVWEERLEMEPLPRWGTPVKKIHFYIRKYPIAAAATTFAFAALAGIGLLMGYRGLSEDHDPAYAELNSRSGFLEVYNRGNELLWKRLVPGMTLVFDEEVLTESRRYGILDIDGDGHPEVLTPLNLAGEPPVPTTGLHVFNGRGDFHDIGFERRVAFRGMKYEMPVTIENGSLLVLDSSNRLEPEIFVMAKNDRSPTAIVRMNGRGEVLGEYWHHGQLPGIYLRDIDGDGRQELVLCGFNDVDDATEPSSPVIAILDPRKIVGRGESQVTRGYGYGMSDAEKYYIKLPLTGYNTYAQEGAHVSRMRIQDNRLTFLWSFRLNETISYDLDFIFSRSLEPLRVVSSTQISQLFEREYARKHISTRLDSTYLDHLRSQVRFWDGKEWRAEPVRVGTAPGGISAK